MILTEQKARVTYDNLIRLIDDPDVREPLKYLREREIVHYQRFGEAILLFQTDSYMHGTPKRDLKITLGCLFFMCFYYNTKTRICQVGNHLFSSQSIALTTVIPS